MKTIAKRKVVFDTAQELYNKLLSIYKTQYDKITKTKKKRIKTLNIPENLSIDLYLDKDYLPPMPALEGDEKVKLVPEETIAERIKKKYRNSLNILTPNNFLTRLSILLVQIAAGNNSYKLKTEVIQILYLLY